MNTWPDWTPIEKVLGVPYRTNAHPLYKRLATIRAMLSELRDLDAGLQTIFGSGTHQYKELPRWSPTELIAREAALGIVFPEELRLFLLSVHGGGPGPGCGFFLEFNSTDSLGRPFAFDTGDAEVLITKWRAGERGGAPMPDQQEQAEDSWPPGFGFVAMSHQGCGVYEVLVITGQQRGFVWGCDMAWGPVVNVEFAQMTFLDWYEHWLFRSLAVARATGKPGAPK